MRSLYNALLFPLRAAAAMCHLVWARHPERGRSWAERRARVLPFVPPSGIWLHGSSMGEARVLARLAAEIRARAPDLALAASAFTPAGRAQIPSPPDVAASFFAPLDFAGLPGRVLDAIRPAVLVLVETELWPNLLGEAAARGVAVIVVNARLSARRMRLYRMARPLFAPALAAVSEIEAQTGEDADRFVALGASRERVVVLGNLKYDLPVPESDASGARARLGIVEGRPVVIAGSTRENEEPPVLDAYVEARRAFPSLALVLAPRHLDRLPGVEREVLRRGLRAAALSSLTGGTALEADVVLVDTLGELPALYPAAAAAFVGGSLVPVGGHNVLEPAAAGVPVLFGPHVEGVREPAEALEKAGGGLRVRDSRSLAEALTSLLSSPAKRSAMARAARGLVRANRGGVRRAAERIVALARGSGRPE